MLYKSLLSRLLPARNFKTEAEEYKYLQQKDNKISHSSKVNRQTVEMFRLHLVSYFGFIVDRTVRITSWASLLKSPHFTVFLSQISECRWSVFVLFMGCVWSEINVQPPVEGRTIPCKVSSAGVIPCNLLSVGIDTIRVWKSIGEWKEIRQSVCAGRQYGSS